MKTFNAMMALWAILVGATAWAAADFPKPYSPPCVERENVFELTEKPAVRFLGADKYEITFAVKGNCDVTIGIIDDKGVVVRHLGAGVLGSNAPEPFQKDSLKQKIHWNGKDDLGQYVKEPGRLQVRLALGLKPVFDRLLGGSDPRNLPIDILGFAADQEGVYVFTRGTDFGHGQLRKFDHDGNYLQSLVPPPSSLPEAKLGGRTYLEYEPGKKAHHGPRVMEDLASTGAAVPDFGYGKEHPSLQAAVVNGKVFYSTTRVLPGPIYSTNLFSIGCDGSTDVKGLAGRKLSPLECSSARYLAASPDGKWMYFTSLQFLYGKGVDAVFRLSVEGDGELEPFVGKKEGDGKRMKWVPGSDNEGLNNPAGLDTDAQGRVYVADRFNNRVQIFSPEGKYLKTLPAGGASIVQVHKKTGAIYLLHVGNVGGRTAGRITKYTSFDALTEELHLDFVYAGTFILDSWAAVPRLWLNGEIKDWGNASSPPAPDGVTILEERGGRLVKLLNFDEEARKDAGDNYLGRWRGGVFDHVDGDPAREQLYYRAFRSDPWVFDLKTGKKLHRARMRNPVNDISFDKRGYLHCHIDPGFGIPGVGRVDPGQSAPFRDYLNQLHPGLMDFKEVPYDYGIELSAPQKPGWLGGLPVKDQPGAKFFQDGFGVNMLGHLAVQSNIYYIPKMGEESFEAAYAGPKMRRALGGFWGYDRDPYTEYLRGIQDSQKRGEEVYSIARRPGVPLAAATIWTFDSTGELKEECAVIAHKLILGSRIDEDGFLYFTNSRAKLIDGKPFLFRKGGNYGSDKPVHPLNVTPVTYTYVKTRGKDVRWLLPNAVIPLEPKPAEPPQLVPFGPFGETYDHQACWTTGVEWMYAGVTPAVAEGCTCPATRPHLDWYKRSYVTEAYRRSLGILDANGNLIMHLGRYGNLDDTLKMKAGSTDLAVNLPRYIGGTDNYLAFDDWGDSLKVLKLEYHAEETVPIKTKQGSEKGQ